MFLKDAVCSRVSRAAEEVAPFVGGFEVSLVALRITLIMVGRHRR